MARDVQDLVNLARGHPGRNSLEGGPAGVASAELAQRTGSPPDSRAGSVSPSGGSAVGLPRSRGGSMTAGEAPGGMAALVGGSSGSPNGSPRRNASSVKGQMGGRVGSSSSLAEEGSDNEQVGHLEVQQRKCGSARNQTHPQPALYSTTLDVGGKVLAPDDSGPSCNSILFPHMFMR